MNTKKRTASFMLIFIMILTLLGGCENSKTTEKNKKDTKQAENTNSQNGRFLEEEITLPKGVKDIMSMRKLSDNTLQVITSWEDQTYSILKSDDQGKTWNRTKISGINKEHIPQTAISTEGNAALFHYAKGGNINVSLAKTNGKTETISLKFSGQNAEKKDSQVQQAAYSKNGKLIIRMSDNTLYTVADDGTCKKAFDTKGISIRYFGMAGNIMTAVHDNGIMLFNAEDEKPLEQVNALDDMIKKDSSLTSNETDLGQPIVFAEGTEDNSIMFANKNGIFHFTDGGSIVEQLIDGTMTSFGIGSTNFYDIAMLDRNNIFVAASSSTNAKIYHYSYDNKAASVPDKEITVYALDESIFLRQAVSLFQKTYPDIHINLEIALSGKDGVTLEDALTVLNTNILAGKGPDVLILDGMPVDSYIEKGVLEDISDIVNEVDSEEGLFSNIVEASKSDGKIYAMPTRLLIPIVEGDNTTVKSGGTLEAFAKRAAQLKNKSKLPMRGPRSLLQDLYYADSATWKKEDGSLDKEMLTDYLKYAKQIYDSDCHNSKIENSIDSAYNDGTLESGEKIGSHRSDSLITGDWEYSYGTLTSIYDLQTLCSTRVKTKTDYCLMNHEKIKSFIPYLMSGVTKSGNKDAGKKFVKLLLGQKAGNSESNGIPVNKTAYDKVTKEKLDAQNVKDKTSMAFSREGTDKIYGYKFINLKQKDIDIFTNIIESLEKPSMTNRAIQQIVLDQGEKYLTGEENLENAVESIFKKVNLYLSE